MAGSGHRSRFGSSRKGSPQMTETRGVGSGDPRTETVGRAGTGARRSELAAWSVRVSDADVVSQPSRRRRSGFTAVPVNPLRAYAFRRAAADNSVMWPALRTYSLLSVGSRPSCPMILVPPGQTHVVSLICPWIRLTNLSKPSACERETSSRAGLRPGASERLSLVRRLVSMLRLTDLSTRDKSVDNSVRNDQVFWEPTLSLQVTILRMAATGDQWVSVVMRTWSPVLGALTIRPWPR
jgi:hypothetical protein